MEFFLWLAGIVVLGPVTLLMAFLALMVLVSAIEEANKRRTTMKLVGQGFTAKEIALMLYGEDEEDSHVNHNA